MRFRSIAFWLGALMMTPLWAQTSLPQTPVQSQTPSASIPSAAASSAPETTAAPTVTATTPSAPASATPETGMFGTRPDPLGAGADAPPTAKAEPAVGFGGVIQMVLALIIVAVGIKFALPKWLPALGKMKLNAAGSGAIKMLESKPLPNGHLHLLEVKGKTLLIAATASGTSLLAELDEPEEIPFPVAPPSEFAVALRHAKPRGKSAELEDSTPVRAEVEDALSRLKKLTE